MTKPHLTSLLQPNLATLKLLLPFCSVLSLPSNESKSLYEMAGGFRASWVRKVMCLRGLRGGHLGVGREEEEEGGERKRRKWRCEMREEARTRR
jgi:hypothetical protein